MMGSIALLYLLFGVGIDPHQTHCYGPAYSVVLVALSFGLVSFISWPVKPGYSGVCKSIRIITFLGFMLRLIMHISIESCTLFWTHGRK
jgi:hypothetical protein